MARQISRLRNETVALIFEKVSGSPDLRFSPVAWAPFARLNLAGGEPRFSCSATEQSNFD
jgi:hypothetical protein